jgi:HK97 family phage portal protein
MGPDGLYQWLAEGDPADWRHSAVAYRCIVAIASNAATCPLEILNDNEEPVEDEIVRLWNHAPNGYMSARVLREIAWLRLETKGQCFIYMDRGNTGIGPVSGLHILDSSWGVEPVVDDTGPEGLEVLVGYRIHGNSGKSGYLLPDEMLWLRYPDPDDIWGCLPPLKAANFALELDDYARRFQTATMARGGTPAGVVFLGDVDEETHRQVRADLAARHERPEDAGRHLVLSGPVQSKYDRISLTAEEVSYLDTRIKTAEEVMIAFGIPRDYLMGGVTYENRQASRATLWSDTILPKLQTVASEIDLQAVPDPTQTAQFDTSDVEALQESEDQRVTRTVSLVNADIITIDEARAEIDLEPLPNGVGVLTQTPYRRQSAKPATPPGPVPEPLKDFVPDPEQVDANKDEPLPIGSAP